MSELPDMVIFVIPKTLSDKSRVFDVKIGDLTLNAVSEEEAADLAEGIAVLVENHTNNTAGVVYDES